MAESSSQPLALSSSCGIPDHEGDHPGFPGGEVLSVVEPGHRRKTVNLRLKFYLPSAYGGEVAIKTGWQGWQSASEISKHPGWWEILLADIPFAQEVRCRYRGWDGAWYPIAPVGGCENLNGRFVAPAFSYSWQSSEPRTGKAKVLLETTLEGILAGFADGLQAPREIQDQLTMTLSQRLLQSAVLDRLQDLEIDEIMAPLGPSVADRSCLNPKFNYLTYAVGDVDWQIGRPADLKALVDALYARGIRLVPDLIFAHLVKQPHEASLDAIQDGQGRRLYIDPDPFCFRDYGTWMYDLGNPVVRRILAAHLASFVRTYRLKVVRFDFVDGILLQYSKRSENMGEVFMRELKALFRQVCPDLLIIGEAFSTAGNPVTRDAIEIPYRPRGFVAAEEIYRPPSQLERPLYPNLEPICDQVQQSGGTDEREAVYAQLHDEAWWCPHIRKGRPQTPWAYGAQPAELARRCGEELVGTCLMQERELLEFVRRRVRLAEALTMFLSNLRYMYLPGVDSLALGRLDQEGRWRVEFDDPAAEDVGYWRSTGLKEAEIFAHHDQHRRDMKKLRQIFRETTDVEEAGQWPLTRVTLFHANSQSSVLVLLRRSFRQPEKASLVVFNLGPDQFHQSLEYRLRLAPNLCGLWKVAFDGDRVDGDLLKPGGTAAGYLPEEQINTSGAGELSLELGAQTILVLTKGEATVG